MPHAIIHSHGTGQWLYSKHLETIQSQAFKPGYDRHIFI